MHFDYEKILYRFCAEKIAKVKTLLQFYTKNQC